VSAHGVRRQHQLLGDPLVRQSPRHEVEDVPLARGQGLQHRGDLRDGDAESRGLDHEPSAGHLPYGRIEGVGVVEPPGEQDPDLREPGWSHDRRRPREHDDAQGRVSLT
jgi:hypothetical protein